MPRRLFVSSIALVVGLALGQRLSEVRRCACSSGGSYVRFQVNNGLQSRHRIRSACDPKRTSASVVTSLTKLIDYLPDAVLNLKTRGDDVFGILGVGANGGYRNADTADSCRYGHAGCAEILLESGDFG